MNCAQRQDEFQILPSTEWRRMNLARQIVTFAIAFGPLIVRITCAEMTFGIDVGWLSWVMAMRV